MQAVEARKLGKKYALLTTAELKSTAPDSATTPAHSQQLKTRPRKQELWALHDVSFSLQPAEMLGVIGDNGSGKSTLLKLLAGITSPDVGDLQINGRVAAMLELGVGFHPDLSGMENVFLNGALLGMTRREILKRLTRIIDFSGIQDFIYSPVKHYSSGMFARLGFSIAINSEAQILLIDEILAVGDVEFQLRCLEEIKRLRALGRSIVLVSHNIPLIEMLCDRVMWLEKGELRALGTPTDVCQAYRQSGSAQENMAGAPTHPYFKVQSAQAPRKGNILASAMITDQNGKAKSKFNTNDPLRIEIGYRTAAPLRFPRLVLVFRYINRNTPVAEITSDRAADFPAKLTGAGKFVVTLNTLLLLQGAYEVSAILHNARDQAEIYDALLPFQTIEVETTGEYLPTYLILKPPCKWQHIPATGEKQ